MVQDQHPAIRSDSWSRTFSETTDRRGLDVLCMSERLLGSEEDCSSDTPCDTRPCSLPPGDEQTDRHVGMELFPKDSFMSCCTQLNREHRPPEVSTPSSNYSPRGVNNQNNFQKFRIIWSMSQVWLMLLSFCGRCGLSPSIPCWRRPLVALRENTFSRFWVGNDYHAVNKITVYCYSSCISSRCRCYTKWTWREGYFTKSGINGRGQPSKAEVLQ